MALSFELFGTLPGAPATSAHASAVAVELERRGASVLNDWAVGFRHHPVDAPTGEAIPVDRHAHSLLSKRGVEADRGTVGQAVTSTFEPAVNGRPGPCDAARSAASHDPVGSLFYHSVAGLAQRSVRARSHGASGFDAMGSAVDCGWRKPNPRSFEAVADRVDTPLESLVHLGDDPATDGGADAAGETARMTSETPLGDFPRRFGGRRCQR